MTRTPPVLTSPSPYTMINPVVSQLLSKRPSRTRLYQYLLWLYPHIHSLPSPSKILHTIATTAFLHELHHETINNSRTLSLLSRVVSSCGTAGSKVMEASSGDCLAIEQELRQWLSLRNPDGVKFYVVKYARRGVYNVRPIFAFDRQWGCKEEWTVEKMDRHPVGAIYLSAELFYGMEECYRSSNGESGEEEEDRRWFDTLLTLSYFREVCRAVAVWAGAKDADGKVANEGWFTWGMPGTGRNGITNDAAVEILQRNIFLGNQIVGLTSCRKHQYLAKRKEEIQFLVQQPGSPVIPSPTTPFPPVILDPHSTEVKFFAHYGPSNLSKGPLKRDGMPAEVGLHHPISVEALHAYLEDTLEYVNFPGKRFKREHDGVHFPDLTWEFGRSWDELCPNWGMNVDGCYEEWVVDGRLGRYRIGGEGKEVEGPWEPVALEVLRVGLDVKEEKESGDEDEDGDDDEDMEY